MNFKWVSGLGGVIADDGLENKMSRVIELRCRYAAQVCEMTRYRSTITAIRINRQPRTRAACSDNNDPVGQGIIARIA